MAKIFGVGIVRLNGVDYRTMPGIDFEMGGEEKESQYASGRRTGASSKPAGSKLTVKFQVLSDTDIEAMRAFEGTAEFITDVNITYAIPNAEIMTPPKLADQAGGVQVTIEGDPATKV
jgi:hypothetical protein